MVVHDPDSQRQPGAGDVMAVPASPKQRTDGRILDEDAFPRSRAFLHGCQGYAERSGCRFRGEDFRGICDDLLVSEATSPSSKRSSRSSPKAADQASAEVPLVGAARAKDSGPLLTVKLQAEPALREFAARLHSKDEGLEEELDRALRIVLAESARNAMIATFQALELWPPSPPPPGVDEEDCAYQDVSAPLPEVAQRLYNDSVRRLMDTNGVLQGLEVRARTASFMIDFAQAIGIPLPETSGTHAELMKEFAASVSAWEKQQSHDLRATCFGDDHDAETQSQPEGNPKKWFKENETAIIGVAAGALAVAAAVASTAAVVNKSSRHR
mmetsp:Transcript_66929/g.160280  ORF Transcript_66929/g.160280 Transcript_66929/m.160280 type:complete len:327 (+) Transcript_66929:83-1063(+)